MRRFGVSVVAVGFAVLTGTAIHAACAVRWQEQQSSQAQQTSQAQPGTQAQANTQPQQPQAKTKKVWTNDDVLTLRTPADNYQAEKEAREKLVKKAGLKTELSSSRQETQQQIGAKESQIAEDQATLDRYTAEVGNEPSELKTRMQGEIQRITAELPKKRLELKLLQDHLEELTKAQPKDLPATPAASPPQ